MPKVTIEIPDTISLSHTELQAFLQSARVVASMANHFDTDVRISASVTGVPTERERIIKIVEIKFDGKEAEQAASATRSFLGNSSLKNCLFESRYAGDRKTEIELDLGRLAQFIPASFDLAANDAGHKGAALKQLATPAGAGRAL